MTTNSHLKNFVDIDLKTLEELSKIADELLEVEHLDADNTEYLAKALFCLGKYDESIEQLERILSLKSDDEQAMSNIGINYFLKEDYDTAIAYFNKSLERDSDNVTVLSYKMLSHAFLKEYDNAIECGEQILKGNSKNTLVINRLIDYHFELENYNDCLDYISQIEYKDDYKKALILYESKRYEECIEASSKIKTAESYFLAGKAYHKLGNTLKAVRYLNKSYEKDLNIDALFEIGEIYFEAEDYRRSVTFLKKVLVHDDSNIEAYNKIAVAYLNSGNWHDAIEYGEKALEISAQVPQAYITIAEAHFQLEGNFEKSKQIIDKGICQNPDSPELWAQKGGYNFPEDYFAFRHAYEKALSLSPNDCAIHKEYIYLLLLGDDEEEAKLHYNQMLLSNPLFEKSFQELKKSMFL